MLSKTQIAMDVVYAVVKFQLIHVCPFFFFIFVLPFILKCSIHIYGIYSAWKCCCGNVASILSTCHHYYILGFKQTICFNKTRFVNRFVRIGWMLFLTDERFDFQTICPNPSIIWGILSG
jgi:hypothetical protein